MSPHLRVKKLCHGPRHPAQIEAHTVLKRGHVSWFLFHCVYMHTCFCNVNGSIAENSLHPFPDTINSISYGCRNQALGEVEATNPSAVRNLTICSFCASVSHGKSDVMLALMAAVFVTNGGFEQAQHASSGAHGAA
ncbi:hypothetical protein [Prosthecobacter sp.]|uniref:hypothetical protein n=1 Tax=Prosthecobacter sp. TaxID=1965333 RepID=UPI0037849DE3